MAELPWPKEQPIDRLRQAVPDTMPPEETFTVSRQELEDALGFRVVPGAGMRAFDSMQRLFPVGHVYDRVHSMDLLTGGEVKNYSGRPGYQYHDFDERNVEEMPFFRTSRGPLKYHYPDAHIPRKEEDERFNRSNSASPTGLRLEMGTYVKNISRWASLAGDNFDRAWPHIGLTVDTDYGNEQEMPLSVNLRPLFMECPKTREQALEVVRIMGESARALQDGQTPSFDRIRDEIAKRTGLQKMDEMYMYFDNGQHRTIYVQNWFEQSLSDSRRRMQHHLEPPADEIDSRMA